MMKYNLKNITLQISIRITFVCYEQGIKEESSRDINEKE